MHITCRSWYRLCLVLSGTLTLVCLSGASAEDIVHDIDLLASADPPAQGIDISSLAGGRVGLFAVPLETPPAEVELEGDPTWKWSLLETKLDGQVLEDEDGIIIWNPNAQNTEASWEPALGKWECKVRVEVEYKKCGGGEVWRGQADLNVMFRGIRITMVVPGTTLDGGMAGDFSLTVEGIGTATPVCEWFASGPVPGPDVGNNPHVTFQTPYEPRTTAFPAWWFASPDQEIGCHADAPYAIRSRVFVDGVTVTSANAETWTVTLPSPGGRTLSPTVAGWPDIGVRQDGNGDDEYYVAAIGTMRREDHAGDVYLPATSQFYAKLRAHEDRHVYQFANWEGLRDEMWDAEGYYAAISDLTAATQQLLMDQITQTLTQLKADDDARLQNEFALSCERDAYAVSNPMAPLYFYNHYP